MPNGGGGGRGACDFVSLIYFGCTSELQERKCQCFKHQNLNFNQINLNLDFKMSRFIDSNSLWGYVDISLISFKCTSGLQGRKIRVLKQQNLNFEQINLDFKISRFIHFKFYLRWHGYKAMVLTFPSKITYFFRLKHSTPSGKQNVLNYRQKMNDFSL